MCAQTVSLPRNKHAWGRFPPGCWTKVCKLTEELDAQGRVTSASTTETKTTLLDSDATGFTLQSDVTVEVAGKRFVAQPRTVRLGYFGESSGDPSTLKKVGTDVLEVSGWKIACEVLESTVGEGDAKVASLIHYSDRVAPFVLKRETKTLGGPVDQLPRQQTQVDVIMVEMPYKVLAEIKAVAYVRTVQRTGKGSTLTLEVYCPDVPGGVVAHTSKELNEAGRPIRRSTLELTDYGRADDPDAAGHGPFIFRKRPRRSAGAPLP